MGKTPLKKEGRMIIYLLWLLIGVLLLLMTLGAKYTGMLVGGLMFILSALYFFMEVSL